MTRGAKLLILLGLVLAGLTAGGIYLKLAADSQTGENRQPVVVAATALPARVALQGGDLSVMEFPTELVPPGALANPDQAAGKFLLSELHPGQVLVRANLVDRETAAEKGSDASFLVPDGMVAVAYPISLVSGVAGALQTGDHVDILMTIEMPEEVTGLEPVAAIEADPEPAPVTQLILQDVEVLRVGVWNQPAATGNRLGGSAPSSETVVTFIVERQDALALKFARERGVTLDLALRPAGDRDLFSTDSVDLEYMRQRFEIEFPRR